MTASSAESDLHSAGPNRRRAYAVAATVTVLIAAAVGYGAITSGGNTESSVEVPVGEATVLEHDSGVRVVFPPGAVTQAARASVRKAGDPPPTGEGLQFVGDVYSIDIDGPPIFAAPVTVTIPYDPARIPAGRSEREVIAVFWHDGEWHEVFGEVDEAADTLTIELTHFTDVGGALTDTQTFLSADERARLEALARNPANLTRALAVEDTAADACLASTQALFEAVDDYQEVTDRIADPVRAVFKLTNAATVWGAKKVAATQTGAGRVALRYGGRLLGVVSLINNTIDLVEFTVSEIRAHRLAAENQRDCTGAEEAGCVRFALENPDLDIRGRCVPYIRAYISGSPADAYGGPAVVEAFDGPTPPLDIARLTDLRSAVLQADRALQTKAVEDWLPLAAPTAPYGEQLALASEVQGIIASYEFSCVGIIPRSSEALGDAAFLVYRARSADGTDLRFSILVGSPLGDPFYRFAPASPSATAWDSDWADTIQDEVPCLSEMHRDSSMYGPVRWRRLDTSDAGTGAIYDLVAGGPGFVAAGVDPDGAGTNVAFWHSVDGEQWQRVVDEVFSQQGTQWLESIIRRGPIGTLYAVGRDDAGPIVWASPDGETWAELGSPAFSSGGEDLFMRDVAPLGYADLVAVGGGASGAAVWTTDGGAWQRSDDPVLEQYATQDMRAVTTSFSGLIAGGERWVPDLQKATAAVWTSLDGQTWTPVESSAFVGGDSALIEDIAGIDGDIVAVGLDEHFGDKDAAVWRSTNGEVWERVGSEALGGTGDQVMIRVARWGSGLVAVGYEVFEEGRRPVVWISPDGRSWDRIEDEAFGPLGDAAMLGVATTDTSIIAVGYDASDGTVRPAVWVADSEPVPPAGPVEPVAPPVGCPDTPPSFDFESIGMPAFDMSEGTTEPIDGKALPPGVCYWTWGFTASQQTDIDALGDLGEASGFSCSNVDYGQFQRCQRGSDVFYLEVSGDDFMRIHWYRSANPPEASAWLAPAGEKAAIGQIHPADDDQVIVALVGDPTSRPTDEMTGEEILVWEYDGAGSVSKSWRILSAGCDPRFGIQFSLWDGIRMCETPLGQLLESWGPPTFLATDGFDVSADYTVCDRDETFILSLYATPAYWYRNTALLDPGERLDPVLLGNPITSVAIRSIHALDAADEAIESLDVCDRRASRNDHGDTFTAATSVDLGVAVEGAIEPGSDRDWFSFVARAGSTYRVEVDPEFDAVVGLFDQNGTAFLGYSDEGGVETIDWTASGTGTYYVEVYSYGRAPESGSYVIRITED